MQTKSLKKNIKMKTKKRKKRPSAQCVYKMQCNAMRFKENLKLPSQSNKVQHLKKNKKVGIAD
jgi:hypothetical protein